VKNNGKEILNRMKGVPAENGRDHLRNTKPELYTGTPCALTRPCYLDFLSTRNVFKYCCIYNDGGRGSAGSGCDALHSDGS
jgi:hypothetical protein